MKKLSLIAIVLTLSSCTTTEVGRYEYIKTTTTIGLFDTKTGTLYRMEDGKWVAIVSFD